MFVVLAASGFGKRFEAFIGLVIVGAMDELDAPSEAANSEDEERGVEEGGVNPRSWIAEVSASFDSVESWDLSSGLERLSDLPSSSRYSSCSSV